MTHAQIEMGVVNKITLDPYSQTNPHSYLFNVFDK